MPVLTSLPENIGDINITMGYPLKQTLVYALIKHLIDLQRTAVINGNVVSFNYVVVISILKHTLIAGLMSESDSDLVNDIIKTNLVWIPSDRFARSENLVRIFKKPLTPALLSEYFKDILSLVALNDENNQENSDKDTVWQNIRNEFIYRVVLSINRLESIVNSPDVSFTTDTYMRILDKMLRIQSVPFSGEPLSGIQIMGILETSALILRISLFFLLMKVFYLQFQQVHPLSLSVFAKHSDFLSKSSGINLCISFLPSSSESRKCNIHL